MCLQQGAIPWVPVLLNRSMGMDNAVASTLSSGIAMLAVISMPLGRMGGGQGIAPQPAQQGPGHVGRHCGYRLLIAAGAYLASLPLFIAGGFFIPFGVSAQLNAVQEIVPVYRRATAWGLYMLTWIYPGWHVGAHHHGRSF